LKAVLLDTHAWAWSLAGDTRLTALAVKAIAGAETVLVSPISFFEIGQRVRLGKWPEMGPFARDLPGLLEQQGGALAELTAAICLNAALMPWRHRDPFDRLLTATAISRGVSIISADAAFDGLVDRVW